MLLNSHSSLDSRRPELRRWNIFLISFNVYFPVDAWEEASLTQRCGRDP
jgi:hypothetical protein